MWWNLDIFGKFAFEIRMDYWYLWKTNFLNFRDFQESRNPLKIPIPTPASDCQRQFIELLLSPEIRTYRWFGGVWPGNRFVSACVHARSLVV